MEGGGGGVAKAIISEREKEIILKISKNGHKRTEGVIYGFGTEGEGV